MVDLTPYQGFPKNPVDWDLAFTVAQVGDEDPTGSWRSTERLPTEVCAGGFGNDEEGDQGLLRMPCVFLVDKDDKEQVESGWNGCWHISHLSWSEGWSFWSRSMVELRKGTIPSSPFSTICFFVHLIESIAWKMLLVGVRLVGLFHSKSQWVLIGLMVRPSRSKWKKVPSLQRFHHRKLTWHNQWALQVTLGQFWTGRFLDWRLGYFRKSSLYAEIGMSSDKWPPKVMDFRPLHVWMSPNALTCILYLDICMIILGSTRVHMQIYEEWMNKHV